MNRAREVPLSNCARNFTLEAIREAKRLDGREVYDYRSVQITLGKEPGRVEVQLGGTRVLACVSCEVVQPRPQRPTEGQLFFNVELSPMASPTFEIGRPSSQATEIGRILDRCLKESRAVDTESLCIIAGKKVWAIRVDLHVLDHCGNITDCATIAAISALKHFRRPDVTVIGEEATIHPVTERDPVPLSVHHMPLCVSFAFFWEGEYLLVDPTHQEEAVMDGKLVVGMNIHREICALQMAGGVAIFPEQVLRCTQIAAVKCAEITEIIRNALSKTQTDTGDFGSILSTKKGKEDLTVEVQMEEEEEEEEEEKEEERKRDQERPAVTLLGEGTAQLGMGGQSTWEVESGRWSSEGEEREVKRKQKDTSTEAVIVIDSSSEEEATVMVTEREIGGFERPQEPLTVALKGKGKKTRKRVKQGGGGGTPAQQTKGQQGTGRQRKRRQQS